MLQRAATLAILIQGRDGQTMLRAEGLPPQTASLKFQNQPLCLNPAPATTQ
jgi:hypothetical protein